MKTRSQPGSGEESGNEAPSSEEAADTIVPVAQQPPVFEFDENSQAFRDALDRALARLTGSRDDIAEVPVVYATGDTAVRADLSTGDQPSSRNPLNRVSATLEPLRELVHSEKSSRESSTKKFSNNNEGGNPCKIFSTRRTNSLDSSSEEESYRPLNKSNQPSKNRRGIRDNESNDASQKTNRKSDKSSSHPNKTTNTKSNNDNVASPRNEADLVSGSISNNDNSEIVDRSSKPKKKGNASRIPPKKGNPSDSSDDSSPSEKKSKKGAARSNPKKKHKDDEPSDESSSSSSESSYYHYRSSYKDHSGSSDTQGHRRKHKMSRRVKKSTWNETNGTAIQLFKENQIHPNSTDKFYRLRQMHSILNSIGLLTLVQGHRKRPILNKEKNKHGYRKSKIIQQQIKSSDELDMNFTLYSNKDIIIEEDDIYYYAYDLDRLYALLDTMFHKDCRHFVHDEIHQERDGVKAYNQICNHVFGQRQQDIQIAENNIINFKLDQSKKIRHEYGRWEQLFSNLSYANNKKISSETKLAFLAKHFSDDGRPLIVGSFAASTNNRMSYEGTIANMLYVADSLPLHLATVQVASMKTSGQKPDGSWDNAMLASFYGTNSSNSVGKSTEKPTDDKSSSPTVPIGSYCYQYQRGQCKRSGCPYPHVMAPKVDKGSNNKRNGPPKGTPTLNQKQDMYIDLPKNILDNVGPKAGQGSNAGHYSNNQKRTISQLMSLQKTSNPRESNSAFSNWANINEAPYESAQERHQVLMRVRIDEDSLRVLRTARQNQLIADKRITYDYNGFDGFNTDVQKVHHRFLISNVVNDFQVPNIPQRGVNAAFMQAEHYQFGLRPREYGRYDQTSSILPGAFIHKMKVSIKNNQEVSDFYTSLLGWHRNKSEIRRPDITTPTKPWMRLLYLMGASMLQACIILPLIKCEEDDFKFNTYNPYLIDGKFEEQIQSGFDGSYWSQVQSVDEYIIVLKLINDATAYSSVLHNTLYADTAIHSVIYDFMAWVAQYLGFYRDNDPIKIQVLRHVLQLHIDDISDPVFTCHGIKEHFQLIARIGRPLIDKIKVSPSTPLTLEADRILKLDKLEAFQHHDVPLVRRRPVFNTKYKNINFGTRFIHSQDREQNDYPLERFENEPPNYVPWADRFKKKPDEHQEQKDNIQDVQDDASDIPDSPSDFKITYSSPETIPNASDREDDDANETSSISSADASQSSTRLKNLTPPREGFVDNYEENVCTDTLGKRNISEITRATQHGWETDSNNPDCNYANRSPSHKVPNLTEIVHTPQPVISVNTSLSQNLDKSEENVPDSKNVQPVINDAPPVIPPRRRYRTKYRMSPTNPNDPVYYFDYNNNMVNVHPHSAPYVESETELRDNVRFYQVENRPEDIDPITTVYPSDVNLNRFGTTLVKSIHMKKHQVIFDSGASTCATSDLSILKNIVQCDTIKAYPAFGPPVATKGIGEYGPLGLDMILLDNMNETLVSISELCKGGKTGTPNGVFFTSEGMRAFKLDKHARKAMHQLHTHGTEVVRAYISNGVYVLKREDDSIPQSTPLANNLFLAQFKPNSQYDHLHIVTGHSGKQGMLWHHNNSRHAKYSEIDESRQRGACSGCVYGAMTQMATDHRRIHRDIPTRPGQCFALDAFTNTFKSQRGNICCDFYTDLATRRVYPVFTKSREAKELISQTDKLHKTHPEWVTLQDPDTRRFFRLDAERSYRSEEFRDYCHSIGYALERTPVRDKHANGVAERTVGLITAKTNVAMFSPDTPVPHTFWDYAMQYACDTQSFNFSSVIGTSPYTKITGQPIDIRWLQPFFASCYVFIPLKDRRKLGNKRAYKAKMIGYAFTHLMLPNYFVVPFENGHYGRIRESKDVIFDPTIDFKIYKQNEEPYDREFENKDHYVPAQHRISAPPELSGPTATPHIQISDDTPPLFPMRYEAEPVPVEQTLPIPSEETNELNINEVHEPYDDENGNPIYWYNYFVRNDEYAKTMCETQHFSKLGIQRDPRVPRTYRQAAQIPAWKEAIDKECEKFSKNDCFTIVPYNGQHLVPMMWTFTIKTEGTLKARLVGRGDLMIPHIDFDPNKTYCGNVSATSIKIAVTIAAKYKLTMRGGDLEGAYLVTRGDMEFPVFIKTPEGYTIPHGMCIQAVGNCYGFPTSGQRFSKALDRILFLCGYHHTPWDQKFFYKWIGDDILILVAHSDDFRWFGLTKHLIEWDVLLKTFNEHKYNVTDCTEKEFVGIRITYDENFNYFMDQSRMIEEILEGNGMKNTKEESLPYPLDKLSLSRKDNATPLELKECKKFPYRRVVGQLMYTMVHTLVTIMYALNVLSRYGNNPGPRHIEFAKHLLRYVKYSKADRLKFQTHDGPYDIETMTKVLQLKFQCDADLAGNPDTKHSQTSYLGYLGGSLICWCSTDQGSISTSTAESEIKAVNHTLKAEVIANRGILNTMGWKQSPTIIEEDNKACVDASLLTHMTRNLRHLELTENFLKEKYADGTCVLVKIASGDNNADIGTKRVAKPLFDKLTDAIIDKSLRVIRNKEYKKMKKIVEFSNANEYFEPIEFDDPDITKTNT